MKVFATIVAGALACPFNAPSKCYGEVEYNTTQTFSTLPEPDQAYPEMRSSVVKTPSLLRNDSKKAFLGTMGPCGNKSLYQSYLSTGELYHCQLDETLLNWAKNQTEDMCTWGFGELAPPGNSTNSLDYTQTAQQFGATTYLASSALESLVSNGVSGGHVTIVGATQGAAMLTAECTLNPNDTNACPNKNMTLQYNTAMAGFKLQDGFVEYMNSWRLQNTTKCHAQNINYGELNGFMGAWIQKVFPCSLLPANHNSTYSDDTNIQERVEAWQQIENLWVPENETWNGCGYIGTSDNIETYTFGSGAAGCEVPPTPSSTTNLTWLWVLLSISAIGIIFAIALIFFQDKEKNETKTQEDDAALLNDSEAAVATDMN